MVLALRCRLQPSLLQSATGLGRAGGSALWRSFDARCLGLRSVAGSRLRLELDCNKWHCSPPGFLLASPSS